MPTEPLTITILYDNQVGDSRLTNKWGFACLVETPATQVLFDTGGDAPTLLANAAILEKDLTAVDRVVLSHAHGDHTGGLQGLLATAVTPTVHMPASFSRALRRAVAENAELIEVTGPREIVPGMWTTGEVAGPVAEQALVVKTTEGWVLITGCAHPGVETMATQAISVTGGPLALVIGGYHLGNADRAKIDATIATLQDLGVAAVAPTHCTGDRARAAFAAAYGDAFHAAGAGAEWGFERRRIRAVNLPDAEE